jgi:hypothetical protein
MATRDECCRGNRGKRMMPLAAMSARSAGPENLGDAACGLPPTSERPDTLQSSRRCRARGRRNFRDTSASPKIPSRPRPVSCAKNDDDLPDDAGDIDENVIISDFWDRDLEQQLRRPSLHKKMPIAVAAPLLFRYHANSA